MKLLILSLKENYTGKLAIFAEACKKHKITVEVIEKLPEDIVSYVKENRFDAVIHRNEHGRLFADGALQAMYSLLKAKIPALSIDFGYFAHYKTFMLDFYVKTDDGLKSSIYNEWSAIPEKVVWSKAPGYIQEYRNEVFQRISRADNTKYSNQVAIWMQWNAKLLRPEIGTMSQVTWLNKVIKLVKDQGKVPVVKHNSVIHSELYEHTVPKIDKDVVVLCDREKLREKSPRLVFDKYANWNLVAGCDYHIAICSSVTNILSLAKKPVIAMGQSWFNALGVFEEPVNFPEKLVKPVVNNSKREKWMNWWLSRQAQFDDIPALLTTIVEKANLVYNEPDGELWKYDYIYSRPEEFPNYGGSMHGKRALPIVLDLAPKSIIDVGCGTNNFIPFIKKHLPKLEAIGVDPAAPQADLKGIAQKLPVKDKEFHLLTCFDVLEHIGEHDIPGVLKEFKRVSHAYLFRAATKDSKIKVLGHSLHPTVKPIDWWVEKLKPLAKTVQEKDGYLFGVWN